MSNDFYPFIEVSKKYEFLSKANPPIPQPPSKPVMPNEPIKYDETPEKGCLSNTFALLLLALGIFFSLKVNKTNGVDFIFGAIFFSLLGILGLAMNLNYQSVYDRNILNKINEYNKSVKRYKDSLINYKTELKDYERSIINYERELHNIKSQYHIDIYRHKLAKDYFLNLKAFFENKNSVLYGQFKIFINEYLSNSQISDFLVANDRIIIFYEDFQFELVINIPYDENGKILSGCGFSIKETGRVQIHIAEEQILLQPKESINYLEYIIDRLSNFQDFVNVKSDLIRVKVWSYQAASHMALKKFRNFYLSGYLNSTYKVARTDFNKFEDSAFLNKDFSYEDLPF